MSRRRSAPLSTCALALGAAWSAALVGCASNTPSHPGRMDHEDIPDAYVRAQRLEEDATDALSKAHEKTTIPRKQEFYDRALDRLREARLLYEAELIRDPGPPEKRKILEGEINRLSDRIAELHSQRPIG